MCFFCHFLNYFVLLNYVRALTKTPQSRLDLVRNSTIRQYINLPNKLD